MENRLAKWDGLVRGEVRFHEVEGRIIRCLGRRMCLTFKKALRGILKERGL